MSWGDASLGLGRLAGLSVNSAPMYVLTDTDSQRRPVEEVFDDHLSSLSKWRADRLSSTRVSLDGDFAEAWLSTLMDYSPNGQLVATEWSTIVQGYENPLAAESIARTVDGRTAMHQWAWAEPAGASAASNTLADFSETRGFAYDARGFLVRDHRIIGRPSAIAASLPDFADVYQPDEGATRIADLEASTLTTINDAFTWSQHGTPLSVATTVQPPSAAALTTTWQPQRPAAAANSPLPVELDGSPVHWDAFGRFHSQAGIQWERTAFDDRPVHVTLSHDDPLTSKLEYAVSFRHLAPGGSEVFEQRTDVNGTTARSCAPGWAAACCASAFGAGSAFVEQGSKALVLLSKGLGPLRLRLGPLRLRLGPLRLCIRAKALLLRRSMLLLGSLVRRHRLAGQIGDLLPDVFSLRRCF